MRTSVPCLFALTTVFAASGCSSDVTVSQLKGKAELPELLDFKDVQVGILASLDLTIKNSGNGVFSVTRIDLADTFSSGSYEFKAPVAPFSLSPATSKTLPVTFQPFSTQMEPVESTITLHTDLVTDKGQPPRTFVVRVKGRGVNSGLLVEPNPVDYGRVLVGSTKTMEIKLTNRLPIAVDITTRLGADLKPQIINQGGLGRFELLSPVSASGSIIPMNADGTPGMLAPDASLRVQVRYIPDPGQEDREDRGRWTIANCTSPLCNVDVQLKGIGTNAAVTCAPPAIEFGQVNPNVTRMLKTTCTNAASEMVTITGWAPGPGTAREYTITPYAGTPTALPPGASFDVEVRFAPTVQSVGTNPMGSVYISGLNPRANRNLTPTRVGITGDAGGPHIVVTPMRVTFGNTAIGTIAKRRILIENSGYSPLSVTNVVGDAARTGAYSTDASGMFTVMPGLSRIIEVSFQPAAVGTVTSSVVIVSNDTSQGMLGVPVIGTGVNLPPCSYRLTPAEMNFGIVQVMHSTTQGMRIENIGTNDCLINEIGIAPGSSRAFRLDSGADPTVTLTAGRSKTVIVGYSPLAEGVDTGLVTFYISDPSNSNPEVRLRGVGSNSALLITPDVLDFGRIGVGCSSRERTVTVFNTGNNPTAVNSIERPAGVSANFTLSMLPGGIPAPPGPGARINPGQSIQFNVRYHVNELSLDTGFIRLFEQGRMDPYVLPLMGEGSRDPTNTDRYRQLQTPEVDIVFVVDNSGSMADKQAELRRNFASFIQFANNQGLDYRIGVVTTDVDPPTPFNPRGCPDPLPPQRPMRVDQGQCGYFADGNHTGTRMDPQWRIVTPRTRPSPEEAFAALADQGTTGSGDEKGLAGAYQALSSPIVSGWNNGFIRPTAYLAIIIVSDDDDQSRNSLDFYVNYFLGIKGFRNTNLFSLSAIVEPPYPPRCANGSSCADCSGEAPGTRYIEAARRTGGLVESICPGTDWARSLQNLGLSVFGYKSRFFLTNQPVPGSVTVTVNNVRIDAVAGTGQVRWTYDASTNSVNFAPLAIPEPGSDIAISYAAECL